MFWELTPHSMALDATETSNYYAQCAVKVTSPSVTMDLEKYIIHTDISSDYKNRHAQIYSSVDRQLIEICWYVVHETI
jgi:hypothetical protein